jgi:hypothetical protein
VILLLLTKALVYHLSNFKKSENKESSSNNDNDNEPRKSSSSSRKSIKEDQQPQDALITIGIQLLGLIAAKIRQEILLVEEGSIFIAPSPKKITIDGKEEEIACICGNGYGEVCCCCCCCCYPCLVGWLVGWLVDR